MKARWIVAALALAGCSSNDSSQIPQTYPRPVVAARTAPSVPAVGSVPAAPGMPQQPVMQPGPRLAQRQAPPRFAQSLAAPAQQSRPASMPTPGWVQPQFVPEPTAAPVAQPEPSPPKCVDIINGYINLIRNTNDYDALSRLRMVCMADSGSLEYERQKASDQGRLRYALGLNFMQAALNGCADLCQFKQQTTSPLSHNTPQRELDKQFNELVIAYRFQASQADGYLHGR